MRDLFFHPLNLLYFMVPLSLITLAPFNPHHFTHFIDDYPTGVKMTLQAFLAKANSNPFFSLKRANPYLCGLCMDSDNGHLPLLCNHLQSLQEGCFGSGDFKNHVC